MPKEWLSEDGMQLLFSFKANVCVDQKGNTISVNSPFEHIHKIASGVTESFDTLHHEAWRAGEC